MMQSTSFLAKLALAAIAYHALAFAALHFMEPQISPISSIIGDYSSTSSGWLAKSAFVAFATCWAALALGLSWSNQPGLLALGRVLFAFAAVVLLLGAIVPSAADPRTPSTLARIGSFSRLGLFVGILLVSVGLGRTSQWEGNSRVLIILGAAAFLVMLVSVRVLLAAGLGGLGQRLAFLLVYVWVWLVAGGAMQSRS